MAYTPATKLPDIQIIELEGQSLASSLNTTTTTVNFSKAILDYDGNVPAKEMIIKSQNKSGETENMFIPAGGLSADGKTATGVVRGVRLDGLDYTTGDGTLTKEFDSGDKVVCPVNAVLHTVLLNVLYGNVASGGNGLIIGDETSGTKTISRSDGTVLGWLRHNGTRVQFSDDGSTWVSNSDSIASALLKISATDTTEGYLEDKIEAGSNITLSTVSGGANEKLRITASSQREGVVDRETYTPAYWTGGASAETNISLWDNVADGSFRITIDGTAYNVDGLDFTSVTTMAEIASAIQVAVRTLTGSDETVTWNTDKFIITSADTTVTSEVNTITTSTGTVGTDISGGTWTDLASGSETIRVLNIVADAGKVALLDTNGKMKAGSLSGENSFTEDHILAVDATGHLKTINPPTTSSLIATSTTSATFTGLAEHTFLTTTIPANTFVDSKGVKVKVIYSDYDTRSDELSLRLNLNGNIVAMLQPASLAGTIYGEMEGYIFTSGADNQKGFLKFTEPSGSLAQGTGTTTEDASSDITLTLTAFLNDASADITIDMTLVELIQ